MKDWIEIDTTNWKNIMNKVTSKREKEDESKSFTDFLNDAEVILVDNAFTFDINKWEKENQEEIDEELSEAKNNISNVTNSHFIKYQLAPDRVKEVVNKIINSDFNIVNYWKTNQFKKKNNLTDDDLKDILRTLTEQDYKTNSISIDNSKNEAIIFIKNTNLKNIKNVKLYIKIDYDSIENSPVIVISFHNIHKKSTLTSSYNNIKKVNDNGYSNSELLEDLYDDDWTQEDEDDIENYEEDNPITPEQKAFGEELKDFFQSLIDKEIEDEDIDLDEEFVSNSSLNKHFYKHCLASIPNRKSKPTNIYYDFNSLKQYENYEKNIDSKFDIGNKNLKVLQGPFNINLVNEMFRKLFEGDFYLTLGWSWGFSNGNNAVQLNLHSFSSDVTTNYKGGNTIDLMIRTSVPKTITLYPEEASRLKNKLIHIFDKYSQLSLIPIKDDKKLLDNPQTKENSTNNYNTSTMSEDLEETSPYTNIKSNGIYSLNTGWVKHPVQQNIPDINMDEFEKEFKEWEDKYFDLLDELGESTHEIIESTEVSDEWKKELLSFVDLKLQNQEEVYSKEIRTQSKDNSSSKYIHLNSVSSIDMYNELKLNGYDVKWIEKNISFVVKR